MKFWKKSLLGTLLLGLSLVTLAGCGNSSQHTVKLGIMGSDKRPWTPVVKDLKKKGINLQITSFNDYSQPNAALQNKQIDINAFQHRLFLKNWNQAHHSHIVAIGNTILSPISLYSQKLKSVSQLKSGDSIAIPNDATNEGRALHLLENAGLIKLDNKALPTTSDIKQNKKHLKIVAEDAAQTARSLNDVKAAVVNTNFAQDAKLPNSEKLYTEKINKQSEPYINIIAANKSDKNKKELKEVVKAFQTPKEKKLINKLYHHQEVPAWGLKLK